MKILLDECLPSDLRKHLVGHDCQTVPRAGLAGKTNGELLALAERSGGHVLLTMDQGIPYQQSLVGRTISLALVRAPSNRLPDLLPHVPAILAALASLKPGEVIQVGGVSQTAAVGQPVLAVAGLERSAAVTGRSACATSCGGLSSPLQFGAIAPLEGCGM